MPASIRSLAIHCGVSTATISRALAGHASVRPGTRRLIEEAARQHGYVRNNLVGALMAHVRRTRAETFVGNGAIVHVPGPGQMRPGTQQRQIIRGAQERARQLGYHAYEFSLGNKGMRMEAVVRVLRARGVLGLIFLYTLPLKEPLAFPWEDFVVVELDYGRPEPFMHTICHDHYLSMTTALMRLHAAGYRRAGVFLERFKDERTGFKWSGAFRSFQEQIGGIGSVPVLSVAEMTENLFARWYSAHEPDVVLGHFDACIGWLRKLRRRVPADVGFFNLNWVGRSVTCAGIDPRLEEQGIVAIEALIAQLQRDERGLPAVPRTWHVPGRFVEGPTVLVAQTVG